MTDEKNYLSLRCLFEKTGPVRFISHLDLTRAFHRAFSRAGIPLKFSEGFSPHPKFSLALPLSVGTESVTEAADFTLKEGFLIEPEDLHRALQECLPAGIRILRIEEQGEKFSQIAYASYRIFLPRGEKDLIPALREAAAQPLVLEKKNKKGKWVEKEISGGIHSLSVSEKDGGLLLEGVFSAAGENYLKPEAVLEGLCRKVPPFDISEKRILRTGLFREDLTPFFPDPENEKKDHDQ